MTEWGRRFPQSRWVLCGLRTSICSAADYCMAHFNHWVCETRKSFWGFVCGTDNPYSILFICPIVSFLQNIEPMAVEDVRNVYLSFHYETLFRPIPYSSSSSTHTQMFSCTEYSLKSAKVNNVEENAAKKEFIMEIVGIGEVFISLRGICKSALPVL